MFLLRKAIFERSSNAYVVTSSPIKLGALLQAPSQRIANLSDIHQVDAGSKVILSSVLLVACFKPRQLERGPSVGTFVVNFSINHPSGTFFSIDIQISI
jgi:hypothetical protein